MVQVSEWRPTIDPDVLHDLRGRIRRTRWPVEPPRPGWERGTDQGFLHQLAEDWSAFDWHAFARSALGLPQYRAVVDGQVIHFVHARGEGPSPTPIVLTHGWPGSFLEYLDLIPLLCASDEHGHSFDVVAPSMPGFGFSPASPDPVDNAVVADLWQQLMVDGLGYQHFAAHGSDIGAGVTGQLALRHPESLIGVHLSAFALPPAEGPRSTAEQAYVAQFASWVAAEGAYMQVQSTKPHSLGFALADSPIGMAGWLVEKYRDWSDSKGDVVGRWGLERLLATLTLYWASNTAGPSIRRYADNRAAGVLPQPAGEARVPAGVALFPHELVPVPSPPRELVERYFDVRRWAELPSGGHFPAIEEPHLLANEIRSTFRELATEPSS